MALTIDARHRDRAVAGGVGGAGTWSTSSGGGAASPLNVAFVAGSLRAAAAMAAMLVGPEESIASVARGLEGRVCCLGRGGLMPLGLPSMGRPARVGERLQRAVQGREDSRSL